MNGISQIKTYPDNSEKKRPVNQNLKAAKFLLKHKQAAIVKVPTACITAEHKLFNGIWQVAHISTLSNNRSSGPHESSHQMASSSIQRFLQCFHTTIMQVDRPTHRHTCQDTHSSSTHLALLTLLAISAKNVAYIYGDCGMPITGGRNALAADSDGCGDGPSPDISGFPSRFTGVNGSGLRE